MRTVRDPLLVTTVWVATMVLTMIGVDLHAMKPNPSPVVTTVTSDEGASDRGALSGDLLHCLKRGLPYPTPPGPIQVKPGAPRLLQRRPFPSRPPSPRRLGMTCACSCSIWPVPKGNTRRWASTSIIQAWYGATTR